MPSETFFRRHSHTRAKRQPHNAQIYSGLTKTGTVLPRLVLILLTHYTTTNINH